MLHRVGRLLLLAGLLGCVALLLWDYVGFQAHALSHMPGGSDFGVLWRSAHTFLNEGYRPPPPGSQGLVYNSAYAVYPPTFFLLFLPISSLPIATAAGVWLTLLQLCVVGTIVVVYLGIGRPGLAEVLVVGLLLLAFIPLRVADYDGQLSPLLTVLAAGAFLATQHRARVLGGVLLGFAIAIKLWPGLLLAYFAWRRQWGVLAGAVVAMAALVGATLALGWGGRWSGYPAMISAMSNQPGTAGDHSIIGAVSRVMTGHTTAAAAGAPAVIVPALVFDTVLVLFSSGAIRRLATQDRLHQWMGYGLALAVLPVFLPFAWIHYWVLAMVLLLAAVRAGRLNRLGRLSAMQLAFAYALLTLADFLAFALAEAGSSPSLTLLWLNAAVPLACVAITAAIWSTRTGDDAGEVELRRAVHRGSSPA